MNIEILKRNIQQVIEQPCMAKYPERVEPKGYDERNGAKIIFVQIEPKDSSRQIILTDDYVDRILENLPERYRDHLVTLRHDDWVYYSYYPVFDTDTQKMWDEEYEKYLADKAEWCAKYGCE